MASETAAAGHPPAGSTGTGAVMTKGLYNRGSEFQRGMNEAARAELVAAAAAVAALPVTSPAQPLAFADFGCSEGGNAVAQMTAAVDAALDGQRQGQRRPVTVTHVDLTGNAWATVFECARAYGRSPPDLFVYAQGTDAGFYQQAFPSSTIALAHGAATFHWASAAPPALPDGCLFAWLSAEPATRAGTALQAAADWATILRHRAAELVPGGRFVASLVAAPEGMAAGGGDEDPVAALPPMWQQVAAAWKSMRDDGTLTAEECAAVVIPVNLSAPEALLAPFADGSGSAAAKDFAVVAATPHTMPFPHWLAYERDGDAAAFGAGSRLFLEAVMRGMMVHRLAAVKRAHGASQDDAQAAATAAVDTFFSRVEAAAAADPQRSDQTVLVLHLERK